MFSMSKNRRQDLKLEAIPSSALKTILLSKRANMYYLEHCRVLVNGGRVEYVTDEGKRSLCTGTYRSPIPLPYCSAQARR
jgi:hypothetical protein